MKIRVPLIIDSGAYSAWKSGKQVDFNEYMAYLKSLHERYPDEELEYINLDVIGDGKASLRNWLIMRDQGLRPIPVYHLGTAYKWLGRYLDLTDRVALSWFGTMPFERRVLGLDYIWGNYLIGPNGLPTARVHGMGVGDFTSMVRYPWATSDATSWLLHAAMGGIFIPRRVNGAWDYSGSPVRVATTGPRLMWTRGQKTGFEVSLHHQRMIEEYVKLTGEKMEGEDGICQSWKPRVRINIRYYQEFTKTLKMPRPWPGKKVTGLWDEDTTQCVRGGELHEFPFGHTIFYLAGNLEWKNVGGFWDFYSQNQGLGRLVSYWYLLSEKMRKKDLEDPLNQLKNQKGGA
jgi:hypothetical protein